MIKPHNTNTASRSFNIVRNELCELGLLDNGIYLDQIECEISQLPAFTVYGYVIEELPFLAKLVGYSEGVIYLPFNRLNDCSIVDIIRHEFAHAWHWLDSDYFEEGWFVKAFGATYDDGKELEYDYDEHVTYYAATNTCEDFAETFMTLLHYRNNLKKFKDRKGVYRKLKAVEKAVKKKSKML